MNIIKTILNLIKRPTKMVISLAATRKMGSKVKNLTLKKVKKMTKMMNNPIKRRKVSKKLS